MTIERPMFPPRADNVVFIGFPSKPGRTNSASSEPQEEAPEKVYWRSRERIKDDIEKHMAARETYGKAVAWEAGPNPKTCRRHRSKKPANALPRHLRKCSIVGERW